MSFVLFILLVALGVLYYRKMKQIDDLDGELSETYGRLSEIKSELDNLVDNEVPWAIELMNRLHHELNLFAYTTGGEAEARTKEEFAKEMRERVH